MSEERKNVPVINVYDFTPVNGEESMYVCMRTTDTDRLVIAEWQSAVRNLHNLFSNTYTPTDVSLSEEEAQKALEKWIGDLGTWVSGEDNVLVCDGIYKCNGKEYYQFRLRGLVDDHFTTLTFYVISVDGLEMFEGQCSNGYINKF